MKFELVQGLCVPKVGFGTWTIGGRENADRSQDEISFNALRSALELGYSHFDTAEYYAGGHCEELLGRAVLASGVKRDKLMITSKVSPEHLSYEGVLSSCEHSLGRLGMDHLDLYLIHWPSRGMDLPGAFRALNRLVAEGRVRHLGVSNFNLRLLKQALALADSPLLTNQVPYNLPDRSYFKNGVLEFCQQNDILLTAYSPVKHRFIGGSRALREVAASHAVSPQQIALAWLVQQPRVITIPMSFNPQHQTENLAAVDMELSAEEISRLNG